MILNGDSLTVLGGIKDNTIDMCITSPPYWGLRDYGHPNQLGLEGTPEEYIEKMTEIFHEVKRVLKKEGTCWLNIGDTYNSYPHWDKKDYGGMGNKTKHCGRTGTRDISQKCLCMIPERLAWALIQDGWVLRNKIIWYKPNGMPSSVKDRFSNKWEYLFMLSKQQKYYFDLDSIKEPLLTDENRPHGVVRNRILGYDSKENKIRKQDGVGRNDYTGFNDRYIPPDDGKNPGDVFIVNTQPFPEAHFAVFPEKLVEKPIKAGCPEGGIVLDPFCGSGTVGVVAKENNGKFVGIDVKFEYCQMAKKRISKSGYQMKLEILHSGD